MTKQREENESKVKIDQANRKAKSRTKQQEEDETKRKERPGQLESKEHDKAARRR